MHKKTGAFFAALLIVFTCMLSPITVLAEGMEIQENPALPGAEAHTDAPAETGETDATLPDDLSKTDEPFADDPGGPVAPDFASMNLGEPIEVTRAMIDDMSPYSFRIGDSEEDLLAQLETRAYVFSGYTSRGLFEIEWQADDVDFTVPGRYTITGKVLLTEEYVYAGGDLTVTSVIVVSDGSGAADILITSCFYSVLNAPVALPLGASAAETQNAFDSVMIGAAICYTEYGDFFIVPASLDVSAIDTNTVGVYYPITVDLPEGHTFGGREFWMLAVHVVPTDEISLGAVGFGDAGYVVQWAYTASEQKLWVSVDDGIFVEGGKNADKMYGYFMTPEEDGLNGLCLPYTNFEAGHVYKFVVQYDDDRLSNALELDFTTGDIPEASNENGGDRTGIDRGESGPPPDNEVGSPPPTDPPDSGQPTTPAVSQPTALTADNTGEGSLIVSGQSLLTMMAANPTYVPFLNSGMWASLPTDYLLDLGIAPGDAFSVHLSMPEHDSFSVSFALNGQELAIPFDRPFLVSIPWASGPVSCAVENGTVCAATLTDGKAIFSLLQMGTYRLITGDEAVPVSADAQGDPTITPVDAAPVSSFGDPELPAMHQVEENPPYKDGIVTVVVACGVALSGVLAYTGITLKRRARR